MKARTMLRSWLRVCGCGAWLACGAAVLATGNQSCQAAPVSPSQAATAVRSWLGHAGAPYGAPAALTVQAVDAVPGPAGRPLYYVVNLAPRGFVVASADDRIAPVICYAPRGVFDPSPSDPLVDILHADLTARLAAAARRTATPDQASWRALLSPAMSSTSLGSISNVWVAPLVQTQWNQGTSGQAGCYNAYTPDNYYTGCVATALAQLMRFWQWPQAAVGTASFPILVNGASAGMSLRGGDGLGGPYQWSQMPYTPDTMTLSTQQFDEIADISADAGAATNMQYSPTGSGTYMSNAQTALKSVFGYDDVTASPGAPTYAQLEPIIYPDLDAGLPVVLSIFTSTAGHCVLADGYGEDAGTMYTHLNVGWGTYYDGINDIWYNLADPNLTQDDFTIIGTTLYNVMPTSAGETVSGMLLDSSGAFVAGVPVTLTCNGATYSATSSAQHGIYAFTGLPSNSPFTVIASWDGRVAGAIGKTGLSQDYGSCGNIWRKNIKFSTKPGTSLLSLAVSPGVVLGGGSSTATITLTEPADSNGYTVYLKSANGAIVTVPATVTVPAYASTATFTISTVAVGAKALVAIRGGAGGVSVATALAVQPPPVRWVVLSPNSVIAGQSATATVRLLSANTLDTTVYLFERGAGASVPTTLTIPAGALKGTFTVTTQPVQQQQGTQPWTVHIGAATGAVRRSAALTITP